MGDFAVLGAGAMGTATSYLLASNNYNVLIWARRKNVADSLNKKKTNPEYMPSVILPERVSATTSLKECLKSTNNVVLAIPSHGVHKLLLKLSSPKLSKMRWLSVIKGMEVNLRKTVSQLLKEELHVKEDAIAVLSGPDFAVEIVGNVPTIGVIGSESETTALLFRKALSTEHFLVEITDDLKGVEVSGILKNIGAIAIGAIDGLNLGDNTRGLIFSRYLQETLEIGTKIFEAKEKTLLGPACLGDMVATAFSEKSRNRVIGLLSAKCITNIPRHTFIAEGKSNARIMKELAREHEINVPVTEFVDAVLSGIKPYTAFNNLWRKLKEETAKK